jgi:hypothetical protein
MLIVRFLSDHASEKTAGREPLAVPGRRAMRGPMARRGGLLDDVFRVFQAHGADLGHQGGEVDGVFRERCAFDRCDLKAGADVEFFLIKVCHDISPESKSSGLLPGFVCALVAAHAGLPAA